LFGAIDKKGVQPTGETICGKAKHRDQATIVVTPMQEGWQAFLHNHPSTFFLEAPDSQIFKIQVIREIW